MSRAKKPVHPLRAGAFRMQCKPEPPKKPKLAVDDAEEYEVEYLVGHRPQPDKPACRQYLVKWLNYPSEANTWESATNLHCPLLLSAYSDVLGAVLQPTAELSEVKIAELVQLQEDRAKAREQHKALKRWERELNQCCGREAAIRVENDVDTAGPPEGFTYISECVAGKGVTILRDPLVGCTCVGASTEGCSPSSDCCAAHAGGAFAYKDRHLVLDAGHGIFECNARCTCATQRTLSRDVCQNRVVQLGRQVPVSIFRTRTRGWGLKCPEDVQRGTFITEYVGELVTATEAEDRSPEYQFELDFTEEKCFQYVIDAKRMGSVSHFINHSCDPNLVVHGVFVDNPDISMPRIGLFAKKFIRAGTELTFDYFLSQQADPPVGGKAQQGVATPNTKSPVSRFAGLSPLSPVHPYSPTSAASPSRRELIPCRCGAKKCRGFIY